jgi:phytoene/squalene synthetase
MYIWLLAALHEGDGKPAALPEGFDVITCGRQLGLFAYLSHIVRDLAEDLRTGEDGLLYLVDEDMRAHGISMEVLLAEAVRGRAGRETRSLVAELLTRARFHLQQGRTLAARVLDRLDEDCRFILDLIITIYERAIDKIEACSCDPMTGRHRLTGSEKESIVREVARRTGFQITGSGDLTVS